MTYSALWQIHALEAQLAVRDGQLADRDAEITELKQLVAAADRNTARSLKEAVAIFTGIKQGQTVIIAEEEP